MTNDIENSSNDSEAGWLALRAKVQRRAEDLLGEEGAAAFLHRGKLSGEGGYAGMYVQTLLCSVSGCFYVLSLLDELERGGLWCATAVNADNELPLTWVIQTEHCTQKR